MSIHGVLKGVKYVPLGTTWDMDKKAHNFSIPMAWPVVELVRKNVVA
jgi:hypothetical protein